LREFVVFTLVPGLVLIALLVSTKPLNASDQLCADYLELPSDEGNKAGMVFIPGGSFTMGSDRERPEERFTHKSMAFGLMSTRSRTPSSIDL
jgi:formylglycine-generating enzyme required for sulfatase activity